MDEKRVVPPPPPPEVADAETLGSVTIRTMESDIKSMIESGGGLPRATTETIQAPTLKKPRVPVANVIIWILGIVSGIGILFFLGYYVVPVLLPQKNTMVAAPTSTEPVNLPTSTSAAPVFLGHKSFFRTPVDETVTLDIGNASSSGGLQGFGQRLSGLLLDIKKTSTFVEVNVQKSGGTPLTINEFLYAIDAHVLDTDLLKAKFDPDFTVFVYRDKNGFWPGYILKWKIIGAKLRPDVSSIENSSSSWPNFFLKPPGNPTSTFRDVPISGQPFRQISFLPSKSQLVYGWLFGQYLIISTSEDGLKSAISRL